MKAPAPPHLASWLLRRFIAGSNAESLIGDLTEQYQRKQSAAWYWRQVLSAIVAGIVRDLRNRPWMALYPVAACFLVWALQFGWNRYGFQSFVPFGKLVWNFTVEHDLDTVRVVWFGRPGLPGLQFMLVAPLVLLVASVISGWVIAQLDPHRTSTAFMCATAILFVNLLQLGLLSVGTISLPFTFWLSMPLPYLVLDLMIALIGMPACILLGGLLGARANGEHPGQPNMVRT